MINGFLWRFYLKEMLLLHSKWIYIPSYLKLSWFHRNMKEMSPSSTLSIFHLCRRLEIYIFIFLKTTIMLIFNFPYTNCYVWRYGIHSPTIYFVLKYEESFENVCWISNTLLIFLKGLLLMIHNPISYSPSGSIFLLMSNKRKF